jgi:hypothetical protein
MAKVSVTETSFFFELNHTWSPITCTRDAVGLHTGNLDLPQSRLGSKENRIQPTCEWDPVGNLVVLLYGYWYLVFVFRIGSESLSESDPANRISPTVGSALNILLVVQGLAATSSG